MFIPPNAKPLNTLAQPPLRLALQGAPGTGKTYAAVTFPNPLVLDFDNKLGAHRSRSDISVIPFYDNDSIEAISQEIRKKSAKIPGGIVDRANTLLAWLKGPALLLAPEQTLIIDSWSMLQNNFDAAAAATPVMGKDGTVDKFEFWARKQKYSLAALESLKSLACRVIVTFHETVERDDSGNLTGKLNPLMDGKVKDQLQQHFTDWYRQIADIPRDSAGKIIPGKPVEYLWQIKSDNLCNCTCSIPRLINDTRTRIPANAASIL